MTDRPILFSGEMVRAILDGRKTMTRRVMKPQPPLDWGGISERAAIIANCKHGQTGDRLWVRETWAVGDVLNGTKPSQIPSTFNSAFWYMATGRKDLGIGNYIYEHIKIGKHRPSIFMPRWASRITLEITGVRVERVQDISEEDARAEGAEKIFMENDRYNEIPQFRTGFEHLWESINYSRGFGWNVNPWVWVIEFRRVTP